MSKVSSIEQFQKIIPIFGNVDRSWRVTSKLRGYTLIQVARRRSKVFQRISASLIRVGDVQGVRDDMPCVAWARYKYQGYFCLKSGKFRKKKLKIFL